MLKKGKLLALCLLAPMSCLSCANTSSSYQRGADKMINKRDKYSEEVKTLTDGGIANLLESSAENQVEQLSPTANEDEKIACYKIQDHGTLTENADIGIKWNGFRLVEKSINPIEVNDLDASINDTITTEWDIKKGYIKTTDSLGGVNYVIKNNDKYWQCFDNEVIEHQKYRIDITNYIKHLGGVVNEEEVGLRNYVVIQSAQNLGFFSQQVWSDERENIIDGLGVDITGFGGAGFNYFNDKQYYYDNLAALPLLIMNLAEDIDAYIDLVKTALEILGATFIREYTKEATTNDDDAKLSIDLGFKKLDLIKLATALNYVQYNYYFDANGKGAVDYFVSYENNFIHQQELVINTENADFAMYPIMGDISIDIKKANINGVINEEINYNDIECDDVKLENYIPIEPKPPVPSEFNR
ncbi:MAG: hypothetical protein MJ207_03365 [Bacilli bacterium]|nr:hypothetical protein [Bacilli bacterium]